MRRRAFIGAVGSGSALGLAGCLTRDADANRFSVALETSEFRGEHVRAYGRWDGGSVALQFEPGVATASLEGDVTVGFAPADARVLGTQST